MKKLLESDARHRFHNSRNISCLKWASSFSFSNMHFSFYFLVRAAAGNIRVLQTFNSLLIRRREKVGLYLETK